MPDHNHTSDMILSVDETIDLLITQWSESNRMVALVRGIHELIDRLLINPLRTLEDCRDIDLAEVYWLDAIGERLGRPRPSVTAATTRFGFDGGDGVGFGLAPFASQIAQLSTRVPMPDNDYRRILKMRGVELIHNGSIPSLNEAVQAAFSDAYYTDGLNGTITLTVDTTDHAALITRITDLDWWPKPSGVVLSVNP